MKKILILSFLAIVFRIQSPAQTHPAIINKLQHQEDSQGKVQIIQDKRIDDLLTKIIDRNGAKRGMARGYRILIFRDNSNFAKDKANAARSKFLGRFPDTDAYDVVQAPWWRIYVGDFRTITDALRMKKQIEPLFPNAFIVVTDINYNKL